MITMTGHIERDNAILDRIIGERRSHRKFTEKIPSNDLIEGIIHAGLHAPYAASTLGTSSDYFRRFFVVRRDSKAMAELIPLVFSEAVTMADRLGNARPVIQSASFLNRLAAIRAQGMVPGVGTAPFYIVIAEKRGFPPVELQSLAHCLENMWLKATALGLGFQIVSITAQMAENPEFCRILGLEQGKWAMMGCAVGYSAETLSPSIRPSVPEVTTWLE